MTSVLRSNQTDKDVSRTTWKDRPLNWHEEGEEEEEEREEEYGWL